MNEPNGSNADTPDPAPVDDDPRGPVDVEGTHGSVLAVVITRNGAGFLERTLTALAKSTRHPDRVVAVDTGSDDETSEWLGANGSPVDQVIPVAADTGFATAVHEGIDTGGAGDYVWLLHDDSAPDPTALAKLVPSTRRAAVCGHRRSEGLGLGRTSSVARGWSIDQPIRSSVHRPGSARAGPGSTRQRARRVGGWQCGNAGSASRCGMS